MPSTDTTARCLQFPKCHRSGDSTGDGFTQSRQEMKQMPGNYNDGKGKSQAMNQPCCHRSISWGAAVGVGHGNDASHGKKLVQMAQSASLNQNSRGSHVASCSKPAPFKQSSPTTLRGLLNSCLPRLGTQKGIFWDLSPCSQLWGTGRKSSVSMSSYLPAWRTPEMLKSPKSVITTLPLS